MPQADTLGEPLAMTIKLADDVVIDIRTANLTDSYWARLLGISAQTVRHARRGKTFQHVGTPPDTKSRQGTGRGMKSDARAARVRKPYLGG